MRRVRKKKILTKACLSLILSAYLFTGCASYQVAGDVQSGRTALLSGDLGSALTHFSQAAQANPDYVNDSSPLKEGVWTYVGRAYYAAGKLPEARNALTDSLRRNENEFMARLYLGLTLLRQQSTVVKAEKPFSAQDISFALKERISPKRVAALIKERGVNFDYTGEIDRELRKQGADDELIAQIKSTKKIEDTGQQGLRETERALKEMQDWLESMVQTPRGRFWDPGKKIRSEIAKNLAIIANKKTDLRELISGGEWVGKAIEEEVDLARRDEREQLRPRP
jgi:tetratricopeptide (TPR) repeat protein